MQGEDSAEHAASPTDENDRGLFRFGPEEGAAQRRADLAAYRYLSTSNELHAMPKATPAEARGSGVSNLRLALLDFLKEAGGACEPVCIDQELARELHRELQQHFSGGTFGMLLSRPQRTEAHRPKENFLQRRVKLNALVYLHGAEMGVVKTSSPMKDVRLACGLRSEGTVRGWKADQEMMEEARERAISVIVEHAEQPRATLEAAFARVLERAGLVYRKHVLDSGLVGELARKKAGT
ncbi:hypothetical protein QTI51_24715 [Variovorax sp. J22G73]|uniref:hypothetical protein n=1 Tax=unclassified Variovorax TaxID=663243 RepID=UPI002577F878|nr:MULTISPECIES: hypothetical protein [unclassified Variovorax]MDM0007874.1 hypothetical protein [Variovorax sp. J22R203]MDM0100503.1 hypothetical protein [Variovorax sp. J22G73]